MKKGQVIDSLLMKKKVGFFREGRKQMEYLAIIVLGNGYMDDSCKKELEKVTVQFPDLKIIEIHVTTLASIDIIDRFRQELKKLKEGGCYLVIDNMKKHDAIGYSANSAARSILASFIQANFFTS